MKQKTKKTNETKKDKIKKKKEKDLIPKTNINLTTKERTN